MQHQGESLVIGLGVILGTPVDQYYNQHQYHDGSNIDIGLYQDVQVVILDDVKLLDGHLPSDDRIYRAELRVDRHGNEHASQRTQGVEGLGKVQTLDSPLLAAQAVNPRVAAGFQE